jgi:hypothetical protein
MSAATKKKCDCLRRGAFLACAPPRPSVNSRSEQPKFAKEWGRSSVGRALEWHSRGQEFDPPRLHQTAEDDEKALLARGFLFFGFGYSAISPFQPSAIIPSATAFTARIPIMMMQRTTGKAGVSSG